MRKTISLILLGLVCSVGISWAATDTAPATKTHKVGDKESQVFLDVENTTNNATITSGSQKTLAYSTYYLYSVKNSTSWVTYGSSLTSSSGTSYTYSTAAAEGYLATASSASSNNGYGCLSIKGGSGNKEVVFYVTGITGVAILMKSGGNTRAVNLKVEEVASNGTTSTVGTNASSTSNVVNSLVHTSTLTASSYYKITVDNDASGNSNFYQIRFIQGASTPSGPSISSFSPASGSTVKAGTTITITGSTGSTIYYLWGTSAPADADAVVSGGTNSGSTTVESGKTLYAVAVKDAKTSSVASASYTVDGTAPTLSSSSPANGATGVETSGTIVLTFSEDIASVDDSKFSLDGATIGTVVIDGTDATKVNVPYSGAGYESTVTLSTAANAVADAVGNKSAALSDIAFTTKTLTYSVTYDANGGDGEMTDSNSPYDDEAVVTVLANSFTAPSGKEFVGWNTKADGSGTPYAPGATFTLTAHTTLYAQWAWPATGAATVLFNVATGTGNTALGTASKEARSASINTLSDFTAAGGLPVSGLGAG